MRDQIIQMPSRDSTGSLVGETMRHAINEEGRPAFELGVQMFGLGDIAATEFAGGVEHVVPF